MPTYKIIVLALFIQYFENQVFLILTGKPERSAYFLAGLNEGGASTLLSAEQKNTCLILGLNSEIMEHRHRYHQPFWLLCKR